MNLKQIKQKILNTDWYNQGATVNYFNISFPWYTCTLMKIRGRFISRGYAPLFVYFHKNGFMDNYMDKKVLQRVAEFYLNKQKKDSKFVQKLIGYWHKVYVKKFFKFSDRILKIDLSELTNESFFKLFDQYTIDYLAVWHEAIFLDAFDYYSDFVLEKLLETEKRIFRTGELELLLAPPRPTFLQLERLAILGLVEKMMTAKNFNKKKKLAYSQAKSKLNFLDDSLKKICQQFHWINNDFTTVEYLTAEHFYKKTAEMLYDSKKLKVEREMKKSLDNLLKNKKSIQKKYKLSKYFLNISEFLSVLGNFRDERKTCNQIANSCLDRFVAEFSRRSQLPRKLIEKLTWWELRKSIFKQHGKLKLVVQGRSKGELVILTKPTSFESVKSASAAALHKLIKKQLTDKGILHGKPAYQGVARGLVRIVRSKAEFNKMNLGDILIAPNTRPEYVPIMKIAGAIVTDEGGITSHAAIVSRELKVPCVVGVQGVTSVLKDGNLIEVDATKGIIKIIRDKNEN